MRKNSLNVSKTHFSDQNVVSNPSEITFNTSKLAPKGAFSVFKKNSVPKNVLNDNPYRKRFLIAKLPYKHPTIVRAKGDWFVRYFYEFPDRPGEFKEFRVRDGVNYIRNAEEREIAIQAVCADILYHLEVLNYSPFGEKTKIIHQVKTGISKAKKEQAVMSLTEALEWYLATKKKLGKTDNTLEGYKLLVDRFIKWCHTKKIFKIDAVKIDDIELFLSEHLESEEWKPRTYNNNVTTITTFFNYLTAKRKLAINPIGIGMLERISNRAEKNKYYDQETLDKVLPEIQKKPALRRYVIWTTYSCARGTELRGLKIKDLDIGIGKITIMAESGKTGAHVGKRSIPICQELMDEIDDEKLMKNPKEWYVFGDKGKPGPAQVSDDYFSGIYYDIKKKLNIDFKFTIYGFKHTRVINLLIAGWDPIKVMYITGHTDWGSFQAYIRELGAVMDKQLVGNTLKLNL